MKIITTSWDDGDVLDFKIANLLEKYSLKGTFYIPAKNNEHKVMPERQIKELSNSFEIGGHTLNHVRLHTASKKVIQEEIQGSYKWLGNLTGKQPSAFAFPGGRFNTIAVQQVYKAGYKIARTTELFRKEINLPDNTMPTTIQVYNHKRLTYMKHLVKRKRTGYLLEWLAGGSVTDLLNLTENYITDIKENGGCFHIWGHSWEINEFNLWEKLEEVFKLISNDKNFQYLANGDIAGMN